MYTATKEISTNISTLIKENSALPSHKETGLLKVTTGFVFVCFKEDCCQLLFKHLLLREINPVSALR